MISYIRSFIQFSDGITAISSQALILIEVFTSNQNFLSTIQNYLFSDIIFRDRVFIGISSRTSSVLLFFVFLIHILHKLRKFIRTRSICRIFNICFSERISRSCFRLHFSRSSSRLQSIISNSGQPSYLLTPKLFVFGSLSICKFLLSVLQFSFCSQIKSSLCLNRTLKPRHILSRSTNRRRSGYGLTQVIRHSSSSSCCSSCSSRRSLSSRSSFFTCFCITRNDLCIN